MKSIIFVVLSIFFSCQSEKSRPDLKTEINSILKLHNEQRRAHIEKNVDLLLKHNYADFYEVNRGMINKPSREESTKRFQSYFDAVDFVKWDDVTPPVFSFSDDATMATTLVNKIVITKQKTENDRLDTMYYAWLAVYKKVNGEWIMTSIASTNKSN